MRNELFQTNPVLKLCFDFSWMVMAYCEVLEEKKHVVVSKQLLRSGTLVGVNILEGQNSESKTDFIHKLKIAAKEADETRYWLMRCDCVANYPACHNVLNTLDAIQKAVNKIITTEKRKPNP